ncbi:carbohydrate-binding module family 1 protein [Tulasnella calospora MUT 4182]|uniref:Carbohydrate-binding module family 1 protein n=1 Tax=Tulasnella calospora MUT 4182 TaxID=1051891 RepID=A0A0C3Q0P4_9AGAM|nr:carbohydrate-binding module family 1 protein [Tulasnella calospora MUT 4182]
MGISNVDSLPSGNAGPPKDVEVYCRMMNFWSIKDGLFSRWKRREFTNHTISTNYHSISLSNNSRMSYQFTNDELEDFYAYNANRAIRMVTEDEGKNFTRILAKPAGYDD